MAMWKWIEEEVDQRFHHMTLLYGKIEQEKEIPLIPAAILGPPKDKIFPVQFLVRNEDPREQVIRKAVVEELDYYLVNKGEKDPWAYACYHCSTASYWYSDIHWSLSAGIITDWNGNETPVARSKGGVIATMHPFQNLIRARDIHWSTPEIVQKLYQSQQEGSFIEIDALAAKQGMGYYCDLQSLHSEDAITWSVFGTVCHAETQVRQEWVADLLKLFDLRDASPAGADVILWRRIPHPDTLVPGGPEIDFTILTDNTVILGEAKWLSVIGAKQGKDKNKDQIQLRGEFLEQFGLRFYPGKTVYAVVGVSFFKDSFVNKVPQNILFRSTTWEQLCSLTSHPYAEEVQRYYRWKVDHSKIARKSKKAISAS